MRFRKLRKLIPIASATIGVLFIVSFAAVAGVSNGIHQLGAVTPGDCGIWAATGTLADSGGPCGTGAAPGNPTDVIYNQYGSLFGNDAFQTTGQGEIILNNGQATSCSHPHIVLANPDTVTGQAVGIYEHTTSPISGSFGVCFPFGSLAFEITDVPTNFNLQTGTFQCCANPAFDYGVSNANQFTVSAVTNFTNNTNFTNLSVGPGSLNATTITTSTLGINGVPPTLTGTCATGAQVGGETAGTFLATCTAQTVILTFTVAQTNGYFCIVQDQTTPGNLLQQISNTNNSCTVEGTTGVADTILFFAIGF